METPTTPGRRSFTAAAAALAAALVPAAAARAQGAAKANRLAMQVSDGDPHRWTLALNNAYNVLNGVAPDSADIEIVAYGPGIAMLKRDSVVKERVASAIKSGIRIVVCENTMAGQHLTPADMLAGIGYVPAGAVELMQKQQQGYAYLRP